MAIRIKHPGMQATIQDIGRIGAQQYGIVVSGAMDALSLQIGNALVNNEDGEAGIEVMFYGTTLECTEDHLISITGGDLHPMINGEEAPMWRPIVMKKGSVLTFKGPRRGLLAYISVAGGLDLPTEIGSKSTFSRAGIGGYKGRALHKGDVIEVAALSKRNKDILHAFQHACKSPTWYANHTRMIPRKETTTIRVLPGSEFDSFSEDSKEAFASETYTLTTAADRMGFTFDGKTLHQSTPAELLSEGVTYGTIQVPVSGKPIVLMAERQTTGGYPKIAQVITADLPKLAQLQPARTVRFAFVSMAEAEKELFAQNKRLKELKLGIYLKTTSGGIAQ